MPRNENQALLVLLRNRHDGTAAARAKNGRNRVGDRGDEATHGSTFHCAVRGWWGPRQKAVASARWGAKRDRFFRRATCNRAEKVYLDSTFSELSRESADFLPSYSVSSDRRSKSRLFAPRRESAPTTRLDTPSGRKVRRGSRFFCIARRNDTSAEQYPPPAVG